VLPEVQFDCTFHFVHPRAPMRTKDWTDSLTVLDVHTVRLVARAYKHKTEYS